MGWQFAYTDNCTPLTDKWISRRETYNRLFDRLKAVVQEVTDHPLAPETIQTDFEVAATRAVEDSFPNTDTRGCFFHYTQSIWKKVQHLEMVNQYRDNPEVNQWVHRAAALPLLPLHQVQGAWLEAMDHAPNIPQAIPFNDYMVTTWVDDDARFKPSVWNHSDNIGPRTNNHLEGWHSHLNKTVQRAHPNIFALIRAMQQLEKTERNQLTQFQHGARPPPRKRIYAELDQRLQRLKDQLSRRQKSPLEILDAAGHIIKLG